jgi:hypothetical protein
LPKARRWAGSGSTCANCPERYDRRSCITSGGNDALMPAQILRARKTVKKNAAVKVAGKRPRVPEMAEMPGAYRRGGMGQTGFHEWKRSSQAEPCFFTRIDPSFPRSCHVCRSFGIAPISTSPKSRQPRPEVDGFLLFPVSPSRSRTRGPSATPPSRRAAMAGYASLPSCRVCIRA